MDEQLEPYLQATIESSNRSRYITFIITFVSMIIFGGYWNSLEFSWFKTANDINHCIYLYIGIEDILNDKLKKPPLDGKPQEQKLNNEKISPISKESIEKKFQEIYPKKFDTCKGFIETIIDNGSYSFNSEVLELEKRIIEEKRRLHHQNYISNVGNISAHFFHENFHINDLPIFSGLSFTILLSILTFSYRRELRNLRKFFNISNKHGSLRKSYEILAMHQVLTVTPSLSVKKSEATDTIANTIPKLLFLIPLILELLIILDTFATYKSVFKHSDTATIINVSFGLLFAGMVLVLTTFCFIISNQIDQLWEETAQEIKNQKEKK